MLNQMLDLGNNLGRRLKKTSVMGGVGEEEVEGGRSSPEPREVPSYARTTGRVAQHVSVSPPSRLPMAGKIFSLAKNALPQSSKSPNSSGKITLLARRLSRSLSKSSDSTSPGLARRLSKSLSRSSDSTGPTDVANANADDLGEVVMEVVLATGLRGPTVGVGRIMPSPFVKVAVRGNEKRTRKEEKTLYPMWNERLLWRGKRGELCTPKMIVEVLDWDPGAGVSMGRAEVDLTPLLVGATCDLMVPLQVRMHAQQPLCIMHPAACALYAPAAPRCTLLQIQGQLQGQLQLRGTWVAREKGKVRLSLESASGLPSPSGKGGTAAPSG